jgi:hypothetical protein
MPLKAPKRDGGHRSHWVSVKNSNGPARAEEDWGEAAMLAAFSKESLSIAADNMKKAFRSETFVYSCHLWCFLGAMLFTILAKAAGIADALESISPPLSLIKNST